MLYAQPTGLETGKSMKTKEVIIEQQKDFIQEMKDKTSTFIKLIDKSEIETILLSGSVSRGDYFPQKKENGEYNGMVDLIVMRKNGSSITAEDRAIYYSHSLQKIPENYAEVISKAFNQKTDSEEDYFRREKIFLENIVGFIEKSKSCK